MKRSSTIAMAAVLVVLGVWHVILRGHGRGIPLITDEGEYAVAARVWALGGLPYRDAFSQKPPMTFLAYRIAAALSSQPAAPRALAALAGVVTIIALFFCVPRTWSVPGRLAGPAAFAALAALPIGDYGFPANTETFLNMFSSLSALAVLQGLPLIAGLAAGAALMTKQTGIWMVIGFGALAAIGTGKLSARAAWRYAGGFMLIPAAWAIYFSGRGALGAYWGSAWAGNGRYMSVLLRTGAIGGQLQGFVSTLLPSLLLFSLPALALAGLSLRGLTTPPRAPFWPVGLRTFSGIWRAEGGVASVPKFKSAPSISRSLSTTSLHLLIRSATA